MQSTCKAPGCTSEVLSLGQCQTHYWRMRSHGSWDKPMRKCAGCGADVDPGESRRGGRWYCAEACKPRCTAQGCADIASSRGLCGLHYSRSRAGILMSTPVRRNSASNQCAGCGSEIPRAVRKNGHALLYCRPQCRSLAHEYGGVRPRSVDCGRCGAFVDLSERDASGRFVLRSTTKLCRDCRRDEKAYELTAQQLADRDGAVCQICSEPVDMAAKLPDRMCPSIDHVIPWSLGGSNRGDNLQLAHLRCNAIKGAKV